MNSSIILSKNFTAPLRLTDLNLSHPTLKIFTQKMAMQYLQKHLITFKIWLCSSQKPNLGRFISRHEKLRIRITLVILSEEYKLESLLPPVTSCSKYSPQHFILRGPQSVLFQDEVTSFTPI
jgi:hypothetical protein